MMEVKVRLCPCGTPTTLDTTGLNPAYCPPGAPLCVDCREALGIEPSQWPPKA